MSRSITVILVAYGNPDDVGRCLSSLAATTTSICDAVVVDNLGDPRLDSIVANATIRTAVVRPLTNGGYGAGVNFGRRTASGDLLMVLNPDVVVTAFDEEAVNAFFDRCPAAILGPMTCTPGGEAIPSAFQRFPSIAWDPVQELNFGFPRMSSQSTTAARLPRPVAWLSGAALLIPTALFDALGGFDEDFFLYYEDVDICRRARDISSQVILWPSWTVQHALHRSTTDAAKVVAWRYHGKLTYFSKHSSFTAAAVHRAATVVVLTFKVVCAVLGAEPLLRAKLPGYTAALAECVLGSSFNARSLAA